jgi:Tol biopolymer transport system component
MSLAAGDKLGPYEILAPLGAGGMGEVFRARDTRLGREVAIKVLPEDLSANPEIRARFEREAKTVSSLNHPNICTLFDVGREGETDYLVMELIDGDTLAARLQRGAIPGPESIRIGMQIADALDRAHRASVIHRDLKPGNIMLTKQGAKLMDFGLARATGLAGAAPGSSAANATLTRSPSFGSPLTAEGTLLGTFQYMSPEQLEGREADARSDIWALGCVLYEMATGRRAFEGRSQASLIAAILERDPAPVPEAPSGSASAAVAGAAPQGLDRLIRNCLAKDPDERIQTAHDVKLQLRGIAEAAGLSAASGAYGPATPLPGSPAAAAAAAGAAKRNRANSVPWAIAAAAILVAVGLSTWFYLRANVMTGQAYRFRPDTTVPGSIEAYWPRVSPDGRNLLFLSADSSGGASAWIRAMDQVTPRKIAGTEGVRRAYWSPDSREIAFIADETMKRLPIEGGEPTVICEARGGADLSWGSKGIILMDGRREDSLLYVPAGGGELRPATSLDRKLGEIGHAWPYFLPDGEHFLYVAYDSRTGSDGTIRLGKIGSLTAKTLGTTAGRVEYAPGGWVVYVRGSNLVAQKLDLGKGVLTGQPIPIANDIRIGSASGHFSISNNGVLAFGRTAGGGDRSLYLVDRRGTLGATPLAKGPFVNPRLSPDGTRVLVERRQNASERSGEIYVLDIARGTDTRLTFSGRAATAEWSPDGRRIAWFTYPANGNATLRLGAADGLGAQDSIVGPWGPQPFLSEWNNVGPQLLISTTDLRARSVRIEGGTTAISSPVDSTLACVLPRLSPDGRWIVYAIGGSTVQVFVQSMTGTPGRWQISSSDGFFPRWSRGGKEIVFEARDGRLMAVDVSTESGFHAGTPRPLFALPQSSFNIGADAWTVDATGEKFLVLSRPVAGQASWLEVVTDFESLVTRK